MNCNICKTIYTSESKICKTCGSILENSVIDESKVIAGKISALVNNMYTTMSLTSTITPSYFSAGGLFSKINTLIINYPFTSFMPMLGGAQIKTIIFQFTGTDQWYTNCDLSNYVNLETIYMCYDGIKNHTCQYVDNAESTNYFVGLKYQEEVTRVVAAKRASYFDYVEPVIKPYLYVIKHSKGFILISTEIKNNYGQKQLGNRKIMKVVTHGEIKVDTHNEIKDTNINFITTSSYIS